MKIQETINLIIDLKIVSEDKSELKTYEKFLSILSDLENRDLTENQIKSIENQLSTLDLGTKTDNRKKYLNKKISEFEKFLKDNLSLIPDGHYTGSGMIIGMLIGVMAQFYFGIYSMLGGMIICMVIGAIMDSEAKKQGRVIKTKLGK